MSPILRTPLCDLLGIDVPIMQAGMGNVAYGRIAAAVSNAGGLGSIGGIDITPAELDEEIKLFRTLSDRPLCVDLGFPANAPNGLDDVQIPELPGPLRTLKKELYENGIESCRRPTRRSASPTTRRSSSCPSTTASRSSPARSALPPG